MRKKLGSNTHHFLAVTLSLLVVLYLLISSPDSCKITKLSMLMTLFVTFVSIHFGIWHIYKGIQAITTKELGINHFWPPKVASFILLTFGSKTPYPSYKGASGFIAGILYVLIGAGFLRSFIFSGWLEFLPCVR